MIMLSGLLSFVQGSFELWIDDLSRGDGEGRRASQKVKVKGDFQVPPNNEETIFRKDTERDFDSHFLRLHYPKDWVKTSNDLHIK